MNALTKLKLLNLSMDLSRSRIHNDAARWVTVNGGTNVETGQGTGRRFQIDENGRILKGGGSAMKGKTFKEAFSDDNKQLTERQKLSRRITEHAAKQFGGDKRDFTRLTNKGAAGKSSDWHAKEFLKSGNVPSEYREKADKEKEYKEELRKGYAERFSPTHTMMQDDGTEIQLEKIGHGKFVDSNGETPRYMNYAKPIEKEIDWNKIEDHHIETREALSRQLYNGLDEGEPMTKTVNGVNFKVEIETDDSGESFANIIKYDKGSNTWDDPVKMPINTNGSPTKEADKIHDKVIELSGLVNRQQPTPPTAQEQPATPQQTKQGGGGADNEKTLVEQLSDVDKKISNTKDPAERDILKAEYRRLLKARQDEMKQQATAPSVTTQQKKTVTKQNSPETKPADPRIRKLENGRYQAYANITGDLYKKFKREFPSSEWDAKTKTLSVGSKSAARLQEWIDKNLGTIEQVREKLKAVADWKATKTEKINIPFELKDEFKKNFNPRWGGNDDKNWYVSKDDLAAAKEWLKGKTPKKEQPLLSRPINELSYSEKQQAAKLYDDIHNEGDYSGGSFNPYRQPDYPSAEEMQDHDRRIRAEQFARREREKREDPAKFYGLND